jgi:hypothetical protein
LSTSAVQSGGVTVREDNLATLRELGFRVAPSLPAKRGKARVRPAKQIAQRFEALRDLFRWVSSPKQERRGAHRGAMTGAERAVFALPRKDARAHVDTIGWKLENMWPLAWMVGFEAEPPVSGEMIDGAVIRALMAFEPGDARAATQVIALEDLFYCAHNAARSAQLGGKTVPRGFHPIAGTGVIHERRHALTWATSPGVSWDKTDLST